MTSEIADRASDVVTPPRVGMWSAAASGWRIFVPVVVGDAAAQALLVASDPVPELSWGFAGLVAGSLLAVLLAVWLTVCVASAAVDGLPRQGVARARQRPLVLAWAAGFGALAIGAAVLQPLAAPLALILGAFVLAAAAAGDRSPAAGFRPIMRAPVRYALAVLAALVAAAVTWALALVLGLFVTGVLAAAWTWLWFGLISTLALCLWCSLYRRARNPPGSAG